MMKRKSQEISPDDPSAGGGNKLIPESALLRERRMALEGFLLEKQKLLAGLMSSVVRSSLSSEESGGSAAKSRESDISLTGLYDDTTSVAASGAVGGPRTSRVLAEMTPRDLNPADESMLSGDMHGDHDSAAHEDAMRHTTATVTGETDEFIEADRKRINAIEQELPKLERKINECLLHAAGRERVKRPEY